MRILLSLVLLLMTAAPDPYLLTRPDLLARPRPKPDATVAYGPDPMQKVDVWLPAGPGPHPVVLMVRGGGWTKLVGTPPHYVDTSVPRLLPLGVTQDLVSGREDRINPYRMATDSVARATAAGDRATLHTVPATSHVELVTPDSTA